MFDKIEYFFVINCGFFLIKGKFFVILSFEFFVNFVVINISFVDEWVKIRIIWEEGKGKNLEEEVDYGDKIRCRLKVDVNDFW